GINRRERPRLGAARIGRDVRDEQGSGALIPEDELRFASVFEVAENLIVMLGFPAFLDPMPRPGPVRVEIRIGILPPPDLVALPVAAEDDVEVAIAVDVLRRAAGLDREELRLDHATVPALVCAPIPEERWRFGAEADDEIHDAIPVEVGDEIACLLG